MAIRVSPVDRTFQLFRHNQSRHTAPCARLSAKDAQYLLDCKFARRLSKYQIVLSAPKTLELRGESCKITLHTILAAISGSERHKEMIEAWA